MIAHRYHSQRMQLVAAGGLTTRCTPLTLILSLVLILFSTSSLAETHTIEIKKMKFLTPELTIKLNDTVVWNNIEKRQYHSVWFEQAGDPEPDYFFPDESYQRSFEQLGSFLYRCGPHPEMTGTIHVVE
ncbi:MAG: plastocyanin/azurin family copper-binding protein [Motiliproteus sp.]